MSVADVYRRSFLTILLLLITVAFFVVMKNFLVPLLLAAIFSALLHPLYARLVGAFRGHRNVASLTTLVIVVVLIVVPLGFFAGVLVSQAIHVTNTAVPWIQQQQNVPTRVAEWLGKLPFADKILAHQEEIFTRAAEAVRAVGTFIVNQLSSVTRGTIVFLFNVAVMLYAMFFFLSQGGEFLAAITRHIPLSPSERERITGRFVSVTRAALSSTIVIGVIQGTLGGIGFAVAGVSGSAFWGTLMAVLSMVPGVGAGLIWVPVCGYLLATGRVVTGIVLIAYFAVIVSSVDNVLRPRLVGKGTQMPDLLVLLSTLGGLMVFGAVGFILGPVIAALFVTMWDIFDTFVRESQEGAGGTQAIPPRKEKSP